MEILVKKASRSFWMAAALVVAIGEATTATAFPIRNVATCDQGTLTDAVFQIQTLGGGEVFIQCNGTISLTSTIGIFTNVKIDAAGYNVVISGGKSVSVMAVSAGATLELRNLSIAHGIDNNVGGGGILNNGNLSVDHCQFLDNVIIGDPEHSVLGGAIANHGTLSVTNSAFLDNSAESSFLGYAFGGAIGSDGPLAFVGNTTFGLSFPAVGHGNSTTYSGGAIYNKAGALTVAGCKFFGSSAYRGGAIFNSGTLNVLNSTFSGNSVLSSGEGGAVSNDGSLIVMQSTFVSNEATNVIFRGAGAIFNDGPATVLNSTFSSNIVFGPSNPDGGAIFNTGGGMLGIDYSTFSGNLPFNVVGAHPGTVTLSDTILVGTRLLGVGENCLSLGGIGSIIDGDYNLEDGLTCTFYLNPSTHSLSNTNPSLGALGNNGGPTQTFLPDRGSPAIDNIPVGANDCGKPFFTDQRGVLRPQGAGCDIGAVEVDIPNIPQSSAGCAGYYTGHYIGDLIIASNTCVFVGGSISGNILLQGGTLALSYVTVGGDLEAIGGSFTIGPSTNVGGNLEIHDYPPTPISNTICGSAIAGNLHVHDNAAATVIGSDDPANVCEGNTIGVNVDVHNNGAPGQIIDNLIAGTLDVHNNTSTVQVVDNTVTGTLTCQNNSSITGGPNPGSRGYRGRVTKPSLAAVNDVEPPLIDSGRDLNRIF